MTRRTLAWAIALLALAATPAHATASAGVKGPDVACTDASDDALRLDFDNGAFGFYALPATAPQGLVVFAHGHGNSAWKWRENLRDTARELGVIAVAMDYRGQTYPPDPATGEPDITKESYGWRVREGAEDSIAAAQLFERECLRTGDGRATGRPEGEVRRAPIVIYGVSMGGNASGLAVAARPTRTDGSPLWDYWFDIEGVANAAETYLEARLAAGPPLYNRTAQTAVDEFHEINGGRSIEQDPQAYADLSVVTHAEAIGAAGLRGVVMVHGVDDGTVPYNQSAEMFAALVGQRVATDFFTVGRRGDKPSGTTLEDTFGVTGRVPGYRSPFTGHGGENNLEHPVIHVGFDRLAKLFTTGVAPRCFHLWLYDAGTYSSDPQQRTLPGC